MNIKEILEKEGIRDFDQDIRTMSTEELLEHFSAASSGKPKATLIIKNQIWQTYTYIKSGNQDPLVGNLRSYWYSHIKPTLARVDLLSGYDHYKTMLSVFVELVGDYHLFRYIDFGFDDENWENRRIATKMFHVVLFSEKTGWFRTLKELYDEYGMSILALGGTPSLLSTEYFVEHLRQVTTLDQKLLLISAVDYDPSGWIIAHSFCDQLESQGLKNYELIDTIVLKNYTPEEIELYKYPIPTKYKKKVDKWIKVTGGINGEAYGLEADSMPRDRYKQIVREILAGLSVDLSGAWYVILTVQEDTFFNFPPGTVIREIWRIDHQDTRITVVDGEDDVYEGTVGADNTFTATFAGVQSEGACTWSNTTKITGSATQRNEITGLLSATLKVNDPAKCDFESGLFQAEFTGVRTTERKVTSAVRRRWRTRTELNL